jgi:DNA-binding MarR family transcriptional regulator
VTQLVDGLVDAWNPLALRRSQDQRRTRICLAAHGRTLYSFFDKARLAQAEALFQNLNYDEVRKLADRLSKATSER